MRLVLAALALLTLATVSLADDGNEGFVQSTDGNWFHAGNPGVPHTRARVDWGEWTYDRYGCRYYARYYYYRFTPVAYAVPNVDSPNFDSELLRALSKQQTRNANL